MTFKIPEKVRAQLVAEGKDIDQLARTEPELIPGQLDLTGNEVAPTPAERLRDDEPAAAQQQGAVSFPFYGTMTLLEARDLLAALLAKGEGHACPVCSHVAGRPLPTPDDDRIGKFHGPDANAPATERRAAILAYPNTGTGRRRVLNFIADAGDHGATDEEMSLALGMRYSTITGRRGELKDDGWVEDSEKRRPTTTGTDAAVWVLTDAAREAWKREP